MIKHLKRAFALTDDLIRHLEEQDLLLKLKDLPSNSIGEQIWCIIGARESYLKAIQNNGWSGFSCALEDPKSKDDILSHLSLTMDLLGQLEIISQVQSDLAYDLLEHEIQHHGQLIRYIYANKLSFPESWHQRYTV